LEEQLSGGTMPSGNFGESVARWWIAVAAALGVEDFLTEKSA
jgi:hypothetical protein